MVYNGIVYHPDYWDPLPKEQMDMFHVAIKIGPTGAVRYGQASTIKRKKPGLIRK